MSWRNYMAALTRSWRNMPSGSLALAQCPHYNQALSCVSVSCSQYISQVPPYKPVSLNVPSFLLICFSLSLIVSKLQHVSL